MLSEEKRKEYAGVFVLENMINKPTAFPVFLEGNDTHLEGILEWLLVKDFIIIQDKALYVPTSKGRRVIERFLQRYTDFLNIFDVFCAVDLESGEFAFAEYFDFDEEEDWYAFLEEDRWEDLRIAVAQYKKIDPVEIVFMSFVSENRFGQDEEGWQFDLLLGDVWDEILKICNTAVHWHELEYDDDDGESVTAEEVMEDIIRQGAELMVELLKQEESFAEPIDHRDDLPGSYNDDDYYVEEIIIEERPIGYYYDYYDPFYLSPFWIGALIIL